MADGGGSRKTHVVGPKKQDRVSHAVSSNERSYADVIKPKVKSIVARESDDMLQLKVGDFVYDSKDMGKLIMAKVKSIDMLAVIINRCKVQGFPEVEEWFSELTHWNRDFVCDERLVWLDIEGMPLRSWCKSNFEKVANRWGQVVYMDGNLGISLAVQRLCVETKVMGIIAEEMAVMIDNHVFVLRIREAVGLWPTFVKEEADVSLKDEPLLDANDFKEEEEDDLFHSEYFQDQGEEKAITSDPFHVRQLIEEETRNAHALRKKEDNGGTEVIIDKAKLGDVNISLEGNNQVDPDVSLAPVRTAGFEWSSNSSDDPSHPPDKG
ncbi:hypothetical protein L2E82_24558 [Cichorium intybus]|uniref:Uncharacterized protein n=1 Tax=Cichorium intybus TaxID=13427 RepID=A0ACB9E0T7_CICIN|nr:hypothetical protein L2E82_24558 [Cichorium intybus]